MPKQPSPQQPPALSLWDIFKAAAKAKPLGTVEAADADEATRPPQQNSNAAIPPNMMGRR